MCPQLIDKMDSTWPTEVLKVKTETGSNSCERKWSGTLFSERCCGRITDFPFYGEAKPVPMFGDKIECGWEPSRQLLFERNI